MQPWDRSNVNINSHMLAGRVKANKASELRHFATAVGCFAGAAQRKQLTALDAHMAWVEFQEQRLSHHVHF
jgi:hypothetical protein